MIGLPLLALLTQPGCVAYLAKSAYFQMELLAGQEPLEESLARAELSEEQREKLALVPEIKAFAEDLGLAETRSYTGANLDWERGIFTVTACPPLDFTPRTWWFPIVGGVPYLGFFREQDAQRREARLQGRGYETRIGRAGAYSTLGWFRDPILPAMLEWSEAELAETLFHELAHATLWIRGDAQFNETFATVVGEAAAVKWVDHRNGPGSAALVALYDERADYDAYRRMLYEAFEELDAVYKDPALDDEAKLATKAAVIEDLPARLEALPLHDPERWRASLERAPWNNARLRAYRTYDTGRGDLDAMLTACGGDIGAFVTRIGEVTRRASDPHVALAAALREGCG
jgi:predicted aminopeptidase